jgi:hypothetical protein
MLFYNRGSIPNFSHHKNRGSIPESVPQKNWWQSGGKMVGVSSKEE